MRTWPAQKTSPNAAAVNVPTTTETVVATVAGISTQSPDSTVLLEAAVQVLAGTTTSAVTVRIRRGTDATGTLVGVAVAETATAAATGNYELQLTDTPGEVAGQSYVITVQQTAATANGTASQGSISATY